MPKTPIDWKARMSEIPQVVPRVNITFNLHCEDYLRLKDINPYLSMSKFAKEIVLEYIKAHGK